MQDVLNKIPVVRWALFPLQIPSRPTLLLYVISQTNTSQQLHKLHKLHNVTPHTSKI